MTLGAVHPKQGAFEPKANPLQALLETLYEVKFSKHTPLVVVLLSMIYTVYRTQHYLSTTFKLDWYVSIPTALFLELLVLAAAASLFLALRGLYLAQLKQEDAEIAQWGVYLALTVLAVAFVALLFIAGSDAWKVTQDWVASFVMTFAQIAQAVLVCCFIIAATLEERAKLRTEFADYAKEMKQRQASQCRYCGRAMGANNLARHEATCRAKP